MSARLRHQLVDDEVLVSTIVAGRPVSVHVTQTEAKRFAWALLSDLDPSDTEDEPPTEAPLEDRYVRGQKLAMLTLLDTRDADTRAVAAHICRDMGHTSTVLSQAKSRGLIEIKAEGRSGLTAIWRITPDGRAWLQRRQERAA